MKECKIKSKIFFILFPIFYHNSLVITSVISFLCVLSELFLSKHKCVHIYMHIHIEIYMFKHAYIYIHVCMCTHTT